ncbi:hypothetical protein GGD38_005036 [Chitinophagaceae bacterium OAS944]|nr:hypothetical protein [Chitinophagaceae bacterium OAS944]
MICAVHECRCSIKECYCLSEKHIAKRTDLAYRETYASTEKQPSDGDENILPKT